MVEHGGTRTARYLSQSGFIQRLGHSPFFLCQEMFCIEERTPTVAGDLELFPSYTPFSLDCNALTGKDSGIIQKSKLWFVERLQGA